jgi:prevent-host-death family protein
MTMTQSKAIPAGEFKARCLSLLDRVAATGEPLVVTKRGKPVAKVVPVEARLVSDLKGSVTFHGDIVGPVLDAWEMDQ